MNTCVFYLKGECYHPNTIKHPSKKDCKACPYFISKGKTCCNKKSIYVKWLGIYWYGIPFPKRLEFKRVFPYIKVREEKYCGCIVMLKDLLKSLKLGIKVYRELSRKRKNANN